MRKINDFTRPAAAVVLSAAFALSACGEPADSVDDAESVDEAMISDNADATLTGEEIEEAVPGIEEAAPEGDTPNTADLGDEENVEVSDIDELETDTQSAEDGAPSVDGPDIDGN